MNPTKGMLLLLFAVCAQTVRGSNDTLAKVLEVCHAAKKMSAYGYSYSVKNIYPDTRQELATGTAYIDLSRKMISEKGDYSTTVMNDKWYYKAEHGHRSVTVIYLGSPAKKKHVEGLAKVLDASRFYLDDSIVLKYCKVISYVREKDIVTLKMKMLKVDYLDTYEIIYDLAKNIPISVSTRSVYPGYGGNTVQEVKCVAFKPKLPPDIFSVVPFFDIKAGKVQLKQYKNYKPYCEL